MDSTDFFNQLTITDIADWDSTVFGSAIDIVQLSPGRFQSDQQIVDLGLVQVLRLTMNQSITARGRGQTSRYAAVMFDGPHDGDFARVPIKEHQLVILPPGFEFDGCVKGQDFGCTATFVDADYLHDCCSTLFGKTLPTDNLTGLIADGSTANRLSECVNSILAAAIEDDSMLQRQEYRNAVQDEIVTLMLRPLQLSTFPPLGKPRSRIDKARRLVNQAEDFIKSQPGSPVRLIELCQHINVSERTLQYAFQSILGVSPIQYLIRFRLHQVRAALSQQAPNSTTVAAEACRWGFWHLSEFASSYRGLFGELPSETLHGKPDNARPTQ